MSERLLLSFISNLKTQCQISKYVFRLQVVNLLVNSNLQQHWNGLITSPIASLDQDKTKLWDDAC